MTAGSVEFMPCRVPPMGLGAVHPPATTIARPPSPSLISKQRIRKNLFGNAEPGEAETLRRNEEQLKLDDFQIRYNVDLKVVKQAFEKPLSATVSKVVSSSSSSSTENVLPSLIDMEIKQHQERLEKARRSVEDAVVTEKTEECNLKAENMQANAETTPQQRKISSSSNNNSSSSSSGIKCSTTDISSTVNGNCGSSKQQSRKPYARQRLVTECFTVRKSTQTVNGKQFVARSLSDAQKCWPELWQESASLGITLHQPSNHHHPHHQQQQQQQPQEPTMISSTQITSTTTATSADFISSNNRNCKKTKT